MSKTWGIGLLLLAAQTAAAAEITLTFPIPPSALTYEAVQGFTRVTLEDGLLPEDEPGRPWVPARYINVLLPAGATVLSVQAQGEPVLVRTNLDLLPVQPPAPLSLPAAPWTPPDPAAYASAGLLPAAAAEQGRTHQMRGYCFVSVRLNPVRYKPAARELYLATNLVLTVTYAAPDGAGLRSLSTATRAPFPEIVAELVANPKAMAEFAPASLRADLPSGAVDYLIITTAALSNSFQTLASHRANFNGLTTRVLTTEYITGAYSGLRPDGGTDSQTSIRNCISNYVAAQGTLYVVLGGDNTIVPDRDCYVTCSGYTESGMPTDLYYAGLNGTWDENANGVYGEAPAEGDLAADVIVARVPVRTEAQASAYIQKLRSYELTTASASIRGKLVMLGDTLWNSYTGDSRPSDAVNDGLLGFRSHSPVSDAEIWLRRLFRDSVQPNWTPTVMRLFTDTLTSWDGGTPGDYLQSAANVSTRFNEGWHVVFFNTHGSTTSWGLESGSFTTGNAAALTNRTAMIYTMACLTGGFDLAEPSLSEAFLRNAAGGALMYLGCSRYGWGSPGSLYGGPSCDFNREYVRQVYQLKRPTVGRAFVEHKAAYISSSGINGAYRWIQFGLNLQGDPLLSPTNIPTTYTPFTFRATGLTNTVLLRWSDPTQCGMGTRVVHIRARTDQYPAHTSDGSAVYTGTAMTCEHTGLTPGQPYYYTIWVSDDGVTFVEPP
jgi:hypothetical protein